MLTREELVYLTEQYCRYKYHYDEINKASEVLASVLGDLKENFAANGNVVAYHDSRIKTPNSFLNKILKAYRQENADAEKENRKPKYTTYEDMHDIVATRLVCLNLSDIDEFVELLKQSDKISILDERDYIHNQKKSGYRSYHVIIEIPFVDNDGVETKVKAEIQLRTILMDIFAREEHKLGYKNNGTVTAKERKELKDLSDELWFIDTSLDNMIRPTKKESISEADDINKVKESFAETTDLFGIVHNDLSRIIKDYCREFDKSEDILHIESRIKPVSSIKRKLIKKKLDFSSDGILKLKDILGYKIVCTDYNTVKSFIEYLNKRIDTNEKVANREVSDHLDEPKESGYRGYKINLEYCPKHVVEKPVTVEILVRTMVQDAWALQQDARIYNKEDRYNDIKEYVKNGRSLRGLSTTLHRLEMSLNELKEQNKDYKIPAKNLVKEVKEFNKINKLMLVKKDEE